MCVLHEKGSKWHYGNHCVHNLNAHPQTPNPNTHLGCEHTFKIYILEFNMIIRSQHQSFMCHMKMVQNDITEMCTQLKSTPSDTQPKHPSWLLTHLLNLHTWIQDDTTVPTSIIYVSHENGSKWHYRNQCVHTF